MFFFVFFLFPFGRGKGRGSSTTHLAYRSGVFVFPCHLETEEAERERKRNRKRLNNRNETKRIVTLSRAQPQPSSGACLLTSAAETVGESKQPPTYRTYIHTYILQSTIEDITPSLHPQSSKVRRKEDYCFSPPLFWLHPFNSQPASQPASNNIRVGIPALLYGSLLGGFRRG